MPCELEVPNSRKKTRTAAALRSSMHQPSRVTAGTSPLGLHRTNGFRDFWGALYCKYRWAEVSRETLGLPTCLSGVHPTRCLCLLARTFEAGWQDHGPGFGSSFEWFLGLFSSCFERSVLTCGGGCCSGRQTKERFYSRWMYANVSLTSLTR